MSSIPLFVLAGGFGTRLRELVSDVPKPLAPVAGRPFLHYLIENWIQQGCREFIFLLHYEAEKIIRYLDGCELHDRYDDLKISFVVEPEPMGTGGAIKYALAQYPVDDFLVANADTWLESGVRLLMQSKAPSIATVEVDDVSRYGEVVTKNNLVIGFSEKRGDKRLGTINAGMYRLRGTPFINCPDTEFSIETTILPKLIEFNTLSATPLNCEFVDIGVPDDYRKFCALFGAPQS